MKSFSLYAATVLTLISLSSFAQSPTPTTRSSADGEGGGTSGGGGNDNETCAYQVLKHSAENGHDAQVAILNLHTYCGFTLEAGECVVKSMSNGTTDYISHALQACGIIQSLTNPADSK